MVDVSVSRKSYAGIGALALMTLSVAAVRGLNSAVPVGNDCTLASLEGIVGQDVVMMAGPTSQFMDVGFVPGNVHYIR